MCINLRKERGLEVLFPTGCTGHGLQSMSQHTLFRRPAPPEPARVASESSQVLLHGARSRFRCKRRSSIFIYFTLTMCSPRVTRPRAVICANSSRYVGTHFLYSTHQLSPVSSATNLYRATNQFNLDHRDSVLSAATLV